VKKIPDDLYQIKLVVFDFDGVCTNNTVWVDEYGTESVRCSRSDGLGLKRLREIGIANWVLSTEVNPVVTTRCKKLKISVIQGCENKKVGIQEISEKVGVALENTAFVGNDINDIPALEIVGFPIVVGDALEEVLPYSIYQTTRHGGEGAVREICDLIYRLRISK